MALETPSRLVKRAELYYQLGSMLSAGVSILRALETLSQKGPSRSLRQAVTGILAEINEGSRFAEAASHFQELPEFDIALIDAGERSGRLDTTLKLLARYYDDRARLIRQVISGMAYPFLVLHMAILIFPVSALTHFVQTWNVFEFVIPKLMIAFSLYAVIAAIVFSSRGKRGEAWRAMIEKIYHYIPLLGSARQNLAMARFCAALEALLSAGVSITKAWTLAASASGSPSVRRASAEIVGYIEEGYAPGSILDQYAEFPDLFTNLYRSAEISGRLDEALRRLYEMFQEMAERQLRALSQWAPRLVGIFIMVLVGYQILNFWKDYYGAIFKQF
jgi:type II secretory pathway component PulF